MTTGSALLDPTLSHDAVQKTVHGAWRAHQRAELDRCLGLRRLFRDNVHRGRGFAQFSDFAEHEFGIPVKLAWTFSALGKHLERLPRTRAAVEAGEIGYTKVREFMRVATERDEAEWIAFARTHTNRELEARVSRAGDELLGREHRPAQEVPSKLTATEVQAARKVREILTMTTGRTVPKSELLGTLVTAVAEGTLPLPKASETDDPPPVPSRAAASPYASISLCPCCARTWVPVAGFDMEVRLDDWLTSLREGAEFVNLLEGQLCDCPDIKHRRDRCPRASTRRSSPAKNRHVPAWVRRIVEARDGHRCRVPGCTCDGPLQLSHLEPYAEGAPTIPETVVQHCWAHNAMIETGRLVVKGRAPFERYFLADGTPLGVGGDPRPLTPGLSHVVEPAESHVESQKPPGRRRCSPV